MPSRQVVAKELSEVFKILAHPDRVRIIEELGQAECDVNSLAEELNLPGPRVSQHLSLMRTARIVEERREGRQHFYRLVQPNMAEWIVEGLRFVEGRNSTTISAVIEDARKLWGSKAEKRSPGRAK